MLLRTRIRSRCFFVWRPVWVTVSFPICSLLCRYNRPYRRLDNLTTNHFQNTSAAKIASIPNFTGRENVSLRGARIGRAMKELSEEGLDTRLRALAGARHNEAARGGG